MLKRGSKDTKLLMITFIVVLFMGITTFHSLLETEDPIGDQAKKDVEPVGRAPSSVPREEAVKVPSSLSLITEHDLNCGKKASKKQIVAGSFIQFHGKNCLKNYKDGDVEIFNKSNGFTASTLTRGPDKYQTDLIQLKKGDNEIVIRYHERSGITVEEVIFVQSDQI